MDKKSSRDERLAQITYEQVVLSINYGLSEKYKAYNYTQEEIISLMLYNLHRLLSTHENWICPLFEHILTQVTEEETIEKLQGSMKKNPLESLDDWL